MRKLNFGTIRINRSPRLKWLDIHNFLGVILIAWVLVVGLTGTVNTLSQVILEVWQNDQLADMLTPYKDLPPPQGTGSVEKAITTAKNAEPEMDLSFVAFPGTQFSSQHHYAVFMKGNKPLTSRLLKPALIDMQTNKVTDSREMPWYVKTLLLSQPLHFGDYGGIPLKIFWAILDIFTIIVLSSGIYLWLGKRKYGDLRIDPQDYPTEIEATR